VQQLAAASAPRTALTLRLQVTWAIRVEGLGKQYSLGTREHHVESFREMLTSLMSAPLRGLSSARRRGKDTPAFWALRHVSFEVQQGEVVGIIGRNGAGKSTLFRILGRITDPTEGLADIRGRVGSLLEVGTGFHPELTGRENIYVNGAILGMRRSEIQRHFDEIVSFAEIEQFLDVPVKRYSSGMYVRLAFAVAAHLEPEVLLVDEVLAVGDAAFQRKCLEKMGDVASRGRTILFISHNMAAIENLCDRALLLERGHAVRDGDPAKVIATYLSTSQTGDASDGTILVGVPRSGSGRVYLTHASILDRNGERIHVLRSGMDVTVALDYVTQGGESRNVDVGIAFHRLDGSRLFGLYQSFLGPPFALIPPAGTFRCDIPNFPLAAGRYELHGRVLVGSEEADWPRQSVLTVNVEAGDFYRSGSTGFGSHAIFMVQGAWNVVPRP